MPGFDRHDLGLETRQQFAYRAGHARIAVPARTGLRFADDQTAREIGIHRPEGRGEDHRLVAEAARLADAEDIERAAFRPGAPTCPSRRLVILRSVFGAL